MATVIDSLLIELGLDTSKFDAAQKKSVDQLRKFDEQQQKTAKNTQQGAKGTAEGFDKAKDALMAFGTAFIGLKAFTNFAQDMTKTNAALGRNANLFSMSARELDAWGGVLKSVGGDAESFQGSLQAMQQGIAGIKLGDSAILTPLARLGALGSIDINKGTVDIYKLSDALKAFREQNGEQLTFSLAQQLGINKETYMVLGQGSEAVHKLYDANYKLSGINEQNTAAAQKLQAQWGLTAQAMTQARNAIMDQLYPAMGALAEGTTVGLTKFVEWDKQLDGLLSQVTIFTGAIVTLQGAIKALGLVGVNVGQGLLATFSKVFGTAALLFHSGELNKGEDEEIRKIHEAQDKAMGKGKGGANSNLPRNLRNNNPGNIEYGPFAKKMGATGSDGRFAIFPDMKTGQDAMASLLMSYAKGGQNTISSIISKWAPGNENNTAAYIAHVAKQTGLDPNKPLSDAERARVQASMTNFEGNVGSKATVPMNAGGANNNVQTNIGTINVQTQATNTDGIVQDLNKSLNNNSLINFGMTGNR